MKKKYIAPYIEFDEIEELCDGMVTVSQRVNTGADDVYNPITGGEGGGKNDGTIGLGGEDDGPDGGWEEIP